jgi:gliding motility-associated-like protein
MKNTHGHYRYILIFLISLVILTLSSNRVFAYGITSIGGSGWSGTLNYSSNSTIYVCYSSSVIIYTDVTAQETVSGTIYYRKWQTSSDGVSWFTTSYSGSGSPSTSGTISTYYRCVQRSTGGVVLPGSETPWVRLMLGPSFVSMPSAVSTTNITGTSFTAHWTTSSTPHGPSTMNIRHYLFCSTTSSFTSGTQAPGFNSSCAKLITACTESTSAIAGCTNPSTPVSYTVTGLTPGVTYYWKVLAQSWHEESSNGDLWCGYQSSYTGTQTVEDCTTPVITVNPSTQTICAGNSASLSVTATGATSYQWQMNGSDIGGATSSSYLASAAGSYTCLVYNTCDSAFSTIAIITVDQPTTAAAGPDQILCVNSATLAANTPASGIGTWSVINGSGSFGNVNIPGTSVSGLSAGVNTFQWSLDNGVCSNSQDQVVITVQDSSIAPIAITGNAIICSGDNTNLSISGGYLGGGASWEWYSGSCGGTNVGTGSSISVSPSANTTYYALATGGCNTTACASLPVTVTNINVDAGTGQTICNGDSITLTATGSGSFLWSYNSLTTPSITVGPGATTTYTVTLTSGSCNESDTVTVHVTFAADATITTSGIFCTADSPFLLTSVDPGGTWSGSGITNGVTGLFNPSVAGPGAHQIIHAISGSCGDSDTTTITVNTTANATITPAGPFCSASSPAILNAASSGGTWSGLGITNASTGEFSPASVGAGTYSIYYTISGICGNSDTISIIVNSTPNATITPAGPFCSDINSVILSAATNGGTWSGQGITNSSTGQFSPSGVGAGSYNVIYSLTGSCASSDTISIIVNTAFDATITSTGPFCNNQSSVFLSAVSPGGTWTGQGIVNSSTGEFSPSGVGIGMYNIIYTIPGACGDSDTLMISVSVSANAAIQPAGPFCSDVGSVILSAVNPGGMWSGQGIINAFTGQFSPSGVGPGTWNVIYTLSGSCGDSDTLAINVVAAANASINPAGPFCINDTPFNLAAADTGGTWSGNGITNSFNGTFDPVIAGVGSHTISYFIPGTCGDTGTISILVNPVADASILTSGSWCSNEAAFNLSAVTAGGNWSGSGVINSSTGLFDPATAGSGNHDIIYTITGTCGNADTATITIYEAPVLSISKTTETCTGSNDGILSGLASGGSNPYTYLWNNSVQTASIDQLEPGIYSLIITDANGCHAADTIELEASITACEEIPSVIYIPNIFSPNGDGDPVNNTLLVIGQGIKNVEFTIYDRWGEKIFESRDLAVGWNGEYKGKPMDQGVYVYTAIIELLSGEVITRKGNVTLVR